MPPSRALRVYERYGLIDPPRTPGGWRRYGAVELTRLNTIGVLKSAGFSLAEIGKLLARKPPPLQLALRAQIQSWKAKKDDAERGRLVAERALERVQENGALSVDELCQLIRCTERAELSPALREFFREMLDLPPSERRAWVERHNEAMNPSAFHEFQRAVMTSISPQLERLMEAGVPPDAAEAQNVVGEHLQLMVRHGIHDATVRWLAQRGPMPALKLRSTAQSDTISSQWPPDPLVVEYFSAAESRSAQCRQLDELLREAGGTETAALVARFRRICSHHALGDPLAYARWAALARPPPSNLTAAQDTEVWDRIAASLDAPTVTP